MAKAFFDAKQIPSVAFTDPEVAWAGLTEDECKAQGIKYGKGMFPWAASGRAIANGRDEGFTKLLFDEETHRIIGGGIVGTHAGDLISEICPAVEMGADAVDIGRTIHPTRRWASRWAWRPRSTKASAPTFRRRASAEGRVFVRREQACGLLFSAPGRRFLGGDAQSCLRSQSLA